MPTAQETIRLYPERQPIMATVGLRMQDRKGLQEFLSKTLFELKGECL